jgi:hypothetical protein
LITVAAATVTAAAAAAAATALQKHIREADDVFHGKAEAAEADAAFPGLAVLTKAGYLCREWWNTLPWYLESQL